MNCLVIGSVWPEPNSSAAGENMMALLRGACQRDWQVTFVSAAQHSPHAVDLASLGIASQSVALNCSSFDSFIADLQPDIVIFDRFMTEEQFSWRVRQAAPDAITVLNTEDLHGLREQTKLRHKNPGHPLTTNEVMIREIAAILRCDLTLIISTEELAWLTDSVGVANSQLMYFPLMPVSPDTQPLDFHQREHMSFIGNFRHLPNWHGVLYLHKIWPKIRKQLPQAQCHIYGAYPPKKATALSNPATGFEVKGWVDDANDAFQTYRLALAPLTFGAGIKGKLIRAVATATPSIVTPIAIQGICDGSAWPGIVADDEAAFINAVVELYTSEEKWLQAQHQAADLKQSLLSTAHYHTAFYDKCEALCDDLAGFRDNHLLSRVVNHHTLKSHQYMSQWIEAKNKLKNE